MTAAAGAVEINASPLHPAARRLYPTASGTSDSRLGARRRAAVGSPTSLAAARCCDQTFGNASADRPAGNPAWAVFGPGAWVLPFASEILTVRPSLGLSGGPRRAPRRRPRSYGATRRRSPAGGAIDRFPAPAADTVGASLTVAVPPQRGQVGMPAVSHMPTRHLVHKIMWPSPEGDGELFPDPSLVQTPAFRRSCDTHALDFVTRAADVPHFKDDERQRGEEANRTPAALSLQARAALPGARLGCRISRGGWRDRQRRSRTPCRHTRPHAESMRATPLWLKKSTTTGRRRRLMRQPQAIGALRAGRLLGAPSPGSTLADPESEGI